jgi:hypothetical protein
MVDVKNPNDPVIGKIVIREGCNNVDFAKDTGQEDYG